MLRPGPLLFALVLALPTAAFPQQGRRMEKGRLDIMFRVIRETIRDHYYDTAFHGVDIDARLREAAERAQAAQSNHQVFGLIAQALSALDDSHTSFWPPDRVAEVRYGWRPVMVGDSCYIVAVARGSDAERQGVRAGDRLVALDGIRPNRRDFWRIEYLFSQLDPRGAVTLALETAAGPREARVASRVIPGSALVNLTGSDGGLDIWDLIRQAGNWEEEHRDELVSVGESTLVWRLPTFAVDQSRLDAGIRRARRYATLVLDLRGNTGGYEAAVLYLIGGTFAGDVDVGTLRRRSGTEPLRARALPARYEGRIVVLVDSRSASASEIYAGTVQRLRRGVVLGDRTAGAVMRSRVYGRQAGGEFAVLFALSVTDAEIVLGDGTRLEHAGVTPDEVLLPTASDIAGGRDPVLSRALALAGHSVTPAAAGALLRRDWRGLDLW